MSRERRRHRHRAKARTRASKRLVRSARFQDSLLRTLRTAFDLLSHEIFRENPLLASINSTSTTSPVLDIQEPRRSHGTIPEEKP